MDKEKFDLIFDEWKGKELKYHEQKKRKYLHFDERLAFPSRIQFFKDYLKNAVNNVPKHSFYPFIKSDITTPRLKIDKSGLQQKLISVPKVRPIAYSSHFDSYLYSWYSTLLTFYYTKEIERLKIKDCVLAYLSKGLCNIDYAKEVFEAVTKMGKCTVLAFDISSFFDGLDHDILKKTWCNVIGENRLPKDHWAVFKSLTSYVYVEKNDIEMVFPCPLDSGYYVERICNPTEFRRYIREEKLIQKNPFYNKVCDSRKYGTTCGIPQGSPISACLSNIYMLDFDNAMNGLAIQLGAVYRRYCDDIIVVCPVEHKQLFNDVVQSELKRNELVINPKKTEISNFAPNSQSIMVCTNEKGLPSKMQYLGFEFNGTNVYIRASSLSRYARRVNLKVGKAVNAAFENRKAAAPIKVYKRGLYKALTEHGKKNFITYAKRAGKGIFASPTIQKQYKNSIKRVDATILRKIKKRLDDENKNKVDKI